MVAEKKDNKDYMLRVRMDKETLKKLDEICNKDNIKRSKMTRLLIEQEYNKRNENRGEV